MQIFVKHNRDFVAGHSYAAGSGEMVYLVSL